MEGNVEYEINKLKRQIDKMIKKNKFDDALHLMSCLSTALYEYNQTYTDSELEEFLLKIGKEDGIILNSAYEKRDKRKVIFYDNFGLDFRGLAYIYLDALCKGGFHVIYLVNKNRVSCIPKIKELLETYDSEIIPIPWNVNALKRTRFITETIESSGAACAFLYTTPFDSSGILAFNHLKMMVLRFQINLTDHAFWLGMNAFDYCLEFRDYGACVSYYYRGIDEKKLILQPFHPIQDSAERFQGYPFERKDGDFVLFSGGTLFKTKSKDNLYYVIVNDILKKYPNVRFWYAGYGDREKLKELKDVYQDQVYYTDERKDLIEIMGHCDAYLSTYPLTGGLMTQYAAMSGIAPLTLYKGEENRGLLKKECEDKIAFERKEDLLAAFDRIYREPEYRARLGRELRKSVISKEEFKDNLRRIIEDNVSSYEPVIKKVNIDHLRENYREKYSVQKLRRNIATRANFPMVRSMPLYYAFCMGNRILGGYWEGEEFDISIFIATYNSEWEKVERAIYSALLQKGIRFEIIVCDDGSKENHFREIEDIFERWGFKNYKLLGAAKNEGTCKNVYKAVKNSRGKYIRGLTPGDYYNREDVLKRWYEWCEERKSLISFGRAIYYCEQQGKLEVLKITNNPRNLWIYRYTFPLEMQIAAYLYHGDLICGVDFMINRELMYEYLSEIADSVQYAEDNIYRLMMFDGVEFDYYPENVCFYEYGTGISTSKNEKWGKLLRKDINSTNAILQRRYAGNGFLKRYLQYLQKKPDGVRGILKKYSIYPWNILLKVMMVIAPAYGGACSGDEGAFYNRLVQLSYENKTIRER